MFGVAKEGHFLIIQFGIIAYFFEWCSDKYLTFNFEQMSIYLRVRFERKYEIK